MVYSIASSFYQLELALLPLGVPVKSGHINKSVQATHITLDVQTRAVFVLDMGLKASILFVLLGADNAVKLPVVTEGVEDLAGGRVLLPRPRDTGLATLDRGLGCPTGV